jgi:hypothetical protein
MNQREVTVVYDDRITRWFLLATLIFGVVGMLVGAIIALQLAWWPANTGFSFLSFGRLRPLHTNAVIFAFGGNAIFAAMYYSMQRLLKTRMWSDALSYIHFWGWQLIILSAAITLPLGYTAGKEYAELEWPIDIAITVVWVIMAQLLRNDCYSPRSASLCGNLVLSRLHSDHCNVTYRQFLGDSGFIIQKLFGLCGHARRFGAMVVWPQCGWFLSNHTIFGPHVLLHSKSSWPTSLFLSAFDHPLLVSGLHLHLDWSPSPALFGFA